MASRNTHEAKMWYSITKPSKSPSKADCLWHFLFQPKLFKDLEQRGWAAFHSREVLMLGE
jgi:hypothetical protein